MLCLGRSEGTTFTMIPPRLFHKTSFLQHPRLVKRDFFQIGFGQWTPQGVHWTLYRAWTANIGRVKSQYTSPECYKNEYWFNCYRLFFSQLNCLANPLINIFWQIGFFFQSQYPLRPTALVGVLSYDQKLHYFGNNITMRKLHVVLQTVLAFTFVPNHYTRLENLAWSHFVCHSVCLFLQKTQMYEAFGIVCIRCIPRRTLPEVFF